jgi:signal transduction histidine kinase
MASKRVATASRRTRWRRAHAVVAALLLAVSTAAAVAADTPRVLSACALVTVAAMAWGWAALAELAAPDPHANAEGLVSRHLQGSRIAAALTEIQLEQAPVALWWQLGGLVSPLNNAARRLVAPGGANAPGQMLTHLREASTSAGRQPFVYDNERGQVRCLLAARTVVIEGAEARLLALMPIESELEAETLKAWRQLVHVLTHEIMNSLTPIASLSSTAHQLVRESLVRGAPEATRDTSVEKDLVVALETIARRTESLATFVAEYRRVSDWPEPKLAAVDLSALFARVERLVASDWTARGGVARFEVVPPTLMLMADSGQLEQCLLNLLGNAARATADTAVPTVHVHARLLRGGRLAIEVRDNGPGVPHGIEQDIFTPFFSTREHGTGIGLAIVRNLVQGMGGTVRHVRPASGGAAFVLSF